MSTLAQIPNTLLFSHSTVTHTHTNAGRAIQLKVSGKQNGAALRLLASAVWLAIVLYNPCAQRRCVCVSVGVRVCITVKRGRFLYGIQDECFLDYMMPFRKMYAERVSVVKCLFLSFNR